MANSSLVFPDFATPGTREWADTLIGVTRNDARFAEQDVRPLAERYQELVEHHAWEIWFDDEPKTLERFCREALGYKIEFLEAMNTGVAILEDEGFSGPIPVQAALDAIARQARARIAKAAYIRAADEVPLPGRGGDRRSGDFQSDNDTLKDGRRGNGESYLRRRLKRDRADLYQKVAAGEMSAHAAAVEAGIRKPTFSVRGDDPVAAARTLRSHYTSPADREALAAELLKPEGEDAS